MTVTFTNIESSSNIYRHTKSRKYI